MTSCRQFVFVLSVLLVAEVSLPQESANPILTASDNTTVTWAAFLESQGPAAVLLWGSWTPESDAVLAEAPAIRSVAVERGLGFVIVALQEPREASSATLDGRDMVWLHDRHGQLLKVLRVYDMPSLVVVSREGSVLARIEASAAALSTWREP